MEATPAMIRDTPEGARARGAARTVRIWCVVPWHSAGAGSADVEAVLRDLVAMDLRLPDDTERGPASLSVRVLVVDNASRERLTLPADVVAERHADGRAAGVAFEQVRLEENRGGSGGFNAGIARALHDAGADNDGYIWLLDSDARAAPTALAELVRTLEAHPELVAAGSALADPETGRVFEVGGMVNRATGLLRPARAGAAGCAELVPCDYVASCSALVRLSAARRAGVMPDLFLHADDVVWMLRLQRVTGSGVAGVASSIVYHPRFDRFALRGRYYAARNGVAPARELGLGRLVACRRTLREVARAVQQELMGRSDLARLHIMGVQDAAQGVTGPGRGFSEWVEGFHPLKELGAALKPLLGAAGSWKVAVASEDELCLNNAEYARLGAELGAAGLHVVDAGATARAWRVIPARGRGAGLLRAVGLIEISPGVRGGGARSPGFVVRTGDPFAVAWRATRTGLAGLRETARLARRWRAAPSFLSPVQRPASPRDASARPATLSVIIVSYNRWEALRETLSRVRSMNDMRGSEIIVVDNASADGSAGRVERDFPGVRVIRLGENLGVAAFNRGVDAAGGDVVLVLDDDSWPEPGAVERALRILNEHPGVGAVTLHPRHPVTGRSEWRHAPFADGGRDDWPILGCGNLVRRSAWRAVGGYEERFFLYRNDADLALKLLDAGWGVYFNPEWTVWHDSPAAVRKSERWHRLATRNWIWLARRHGRGITLDGALGALLGWTWAHRLAGGRPRLHWATLRGAFDGFMRPAPPVPLPNRSRTHFGRLARLSMGRPDRSRGRATG